MCQMSSTVLSPSYITSLSQVSHCCASSIFHRHILIFYYFFSEGLVSLCMRHLLQAYSRRTQIDFLTHVHAKVWPVLIPQSSQSLVEELGGTSTTPPSSALNRP